MKSKHKNPLPRLAITFFALFLISKVDFADPLNLGLIRLAYALVQCMTFLFCLFLYLKISRFSDEPKTVKVPPTVAWGQTPDPTEFTMMSVKEYDLSQVKKLFSSTMLMTAISTLIHLKWAIIPPLLMQAVMAPLTLYSNPLVQIYLFGDNPPRPFTDDTSDSPFAGLSKLFQGDEGADATPPPEEIDPDSVASMPVDDSASTSTSELKKRKGKKKNQKKETETEVQDEDPVTLD